jgi:LuxR family maltose regulon positive regulatory protein
MPAIEALCLEGARELTAEAARCVAQVPGATRLAAWARDLADRVDAYADEILDGPGALTAAERRVLGYLPSHLSFREIGTQAHAAYRKLDASSRSGAVARARGRAARRHPVGRMRPSRGAPTVSR